jgi:hypothetical protein
VPSFRPEGLIIGATWSNSICRFVCLPVVQRAAAAMADPWSPGVLHAAHGIYSMSEVRAKHALACSCCTKFTRVPTRHIGKPTTSTHTCSPSCRSGGLNLANRQAVLAHLPELSVSVRQDFNRHTVQQVAGTPKLSASAKLASAGISLSSNLHAHQSSAVGELRLVASPLGGA